MWTTSFILWSDRYSDGLNEVVTKSNDMVQRCARKETELMHSTELVMQLEEEKAALSAEIRELQRQLEQLRKTSQNTEKELEVGCDCVGYGSLQQ